MPELNKIQKELMQEAFVLNEEYRQNIKTEISKLEDKISDIQNEEKIQKKVDKFEEDLILLKNKLSNFDKVKDNFAKVSEQLSLFPEDEEKKEAA